MCVQMYSLSDCLSTFLFLLLANTTSKLQERCELWKLSVKVSALNGLLCVYIAQNSISNLAECNKTAKPNKSFITFTVQIDSTWKLFSNWNEIIESTNCFTGKERSPYVWFRDYYFFNHSVFNLIMQMLGILNANWCLTMPTKTLDFWHFDRFW